MPTHQAPVEWGVWEAEGRRPRIEYSRALMEEIRCAAVAGLQAAPHGGLEVGGVLFGDYDGQTVRITAQRPLTCAHAQGPAFILSPKDEAALAELLKQAVEEGLHPVGWYHSHTRGEMALSHEDLLIYKRYFPQLWQVALLLRPQRTDYTRAIFLLREAGGAVRGPSDEEVFTVTPFLQADRQAPSKPGSGLAGRPTPARENGVARAKLAAAPSHPTRAGLWPWLASAVLLLEGAGLAASSYFAGADAPLHLKAAESGSRLVFSWDPQAAAVQQARAGLLEIKDGSRRTRLDFDARQLREGSLSYSRESDRVEACLRLERWWGAPIQEQVIFLSELPPAVLMEAPEAAALRQALRERDELAAEVQRLRRDLRNQRAQVARLEQVNRQLRQPAAQQAVPRP